MFLQWMFAPAPLELGLSGTSETQGKREPFAFPLLQSFACPLFSTSHRKCLNSAVLTLPWASKFFHDLGDYLLYNPNAPALPWTRNQKLPLSSTRLVTPEMKTLLTLSYLMVPLIKRTTAQNLNNIPSCAVRTDSSIKIKTLRYH